MTHPMQFEFVMLQPQVSLETETVVLLGLKPRRKRSSFKRSLTGCLTCRRRHKKCDEKFNPKCSGCERNFLECLRPGRLREESREQAVGPVVEAVPLPSQLQLAGTSPLNLDDFANLVQSPPSTLHLGPVEEVAVPSPSSQLLLDYYLLWIPLVQLSREQAHLYYTCATVFLPLFTQPHCTQEHLPARTFLPFGAQSAELREIFFACGAAMLAGQEPDEHLLREAYTRYLRALDMLMDAVALGRVRGDEDWFFVAVQTLQTLCLRDRSFGHNATRCAAHLTAAHGVVCKRYPQRLLEPGGGASRRSSDGMDTGAGTGAEAAEIEGTPPLPPLDRTLLENFVFNYSVTIFFCNHHKLRQLLPLPFHFFDRNRWLVEPLHRWERVWGLADGTRCHPWIDASLLGVAARAFEVAAKASWLVRLHMPLNDNARWLALRLQRTIETNVLVDVDTVERRCAVTFGSTQAAAYASNAGTARIVMLALGILITKMLHPEVRSPDEVIQRQVREMMAEMRRVEQLSPHYAMPIWAMIIGGLALMNEEQAVYFRDQCDRLAQLIRSTICRRVMDHLEHLRAHGLYQSGEAFEMLFNTEIMDLVAM